MFPMCYVSSMEFSTSEALKTLSLTASWCFTPLVDISFLFQVTGLSLSRQQSSQSALTFFFSLKAQKARSNFCSACALHVSIPICQLGRAPSRSKNEEENILPFLFPSTMCFPFYAYNNHPERRIM